MTTGKINALELIQKARSQESLEVKVEICEGLTGVFSAPDIYSIQEEQILMAEDKLKICEERGHSGRKINEEEWKAQLQISLDAARERGKSDEEIENLKKVLEQNKPVDRAHQIADKLAKMSLIKEIIPKVIRYESGELMFPTEKERNEFKNELARNPLLLDKLADAYLEIVTKNNKLREDAKNLSEQES